MTEKEIYEYEMKCLCDEYDSIAKQIGILEQRGEDVGNGYDLLNDLAKEIYLTKHNYEKLEQ